MMLRKMQKLLASVRTSKKPASDRSRAEKVEKVSRRDFFKKTAVGTVALTGTAELARVTASSIPDDTAQQLYGKDILAGARVLKEREYVVMSDQEKEEMIQGFVDDYRGNS
jgi:hypothetical protein